MIGQTINNYVLERKLGEGGMGDVYFARHNRIDRVVAIKVLHKNLFTNESIRSRFKNEANALIKLGHPNIVKIYDYVEQEDYACLIMEYIEGFTLDDYITKVTGPLPAPKATNIICSVLEAVQYAHDNNIFHRDIKPGNIMISRDGRTVRIMDFSIAKFTDGANLKTTHANAQIGTPFYMSPEQVKGMAYTAQSDIYSIGVTLFEMVTGKCPYLEITNLFELQSKIVNEPLPPTSKYYPNVTGRLQDAIALATNKMPEQRFKSCNEFKDYLVEGEKAHPVFIPAQTPLPKPNVTQPRPEKIKPEPAYNPVFIEQKKKNNRWIYLLWLVIISAIGIFVYSFINQPPTKPQRDILQEADSLISLREKIMPAILLNSIERNQLKEKLVAPLTTNNISLVNSILDSTFTKKIDPPESLPLPAPEKNIPDSVIQEPEPYYPAPSSQRIITDLANDKQQAIKCGLFNQEDKLIGLASSLSADGKQWVAKMTFKTSDDAKYEVNAIYNKTEKGYSYRNMSGCKFLQGDAPVNPPDNKSVSMYPNNDEIIKDLKERLRKKKKTNLIDDQYIDELSISSIGSPIENDDGSITYYVEFKINGKERNEKISYKKADKNYQLIEK